VSVLDWQIALITAAAVAATLFPILYTFIAPWWRTVVGRSLVISEVSLAALLDTALLAYWFHTTVPSPIRTSLYTLIAIGAWMRIGALIDQQLKKSRHKETP
jgi:hypothetical protein